MTSASTLSLEIVETKRLGHTWTMPARSTECIRSTIYQVTMWLIEHQRQTLSVQGTSMTNWIRLESTCEKRW